jgi:hypothetical protein
MALIPGTLIEKARGIHPAFEPRRNPTPPLVGLLSSWQREIMAKVAKLNPSAVAAALVVELPLADFDAGFPLPPYHYARGASVVGKDGSTTEFHLIGAGARHGGGPSPWYGWTLGNRLHLRGTAASWAAIARVTLEVVAVPAELASAATPLSLPDNAEAAAIAFLADTLATRVPAGGGVPAARLAANARQAEAQLLDELAGRRRAQVWRIRDRSI